MLPPSEVANQMSSPLAPTMASWDCGASWAAKRQEGKNGVTEQGKMLGISGISQVGSEGTNLDVFSFGVD